MRNVVQKPSGYKGSVHSQITGYYTSVQSEISGTLSVRNWLSTKSFEEQFEFGLDVLRRYGTVVATEKGWLFIPFG